MLLSPRVTGLLIAATVLLCSIKTENLEPTTTVDNGEQRAEGVLASCDHGDDVALPQVNVNSKKKSRRERCSKLEKLRHIFKKGKPGLDVYKAQAENGKYEAREVANKSPAGLLTLRGYKLEEHYAITKDGYHLHLIRIINPALPQDFKLKRPVLFNHGFIGSSTIWLINSKGVKPAANTDHCHSLPIDIELAKTSAEFTNTPMMLANNGYDVWLLSTRGTDWSLNHDTLDTSSSKFWDFSFDEFALEDIPAAINYIQQKTDAPKVGYIGYSQATWTIFSLLTKETHYADIIEPVIAVGPYAYLEQTSNFAKLFFKLTAAIEKTDGRLPESPRKLRAALRTVCLSGGLFSLPFACKLLNVLLGGSSEELPAGYFTHLPYSSSHKVARHASQLIRAKAYQMYDHGKEENLKRYGTTEPPSYDLGKIRSKSLVLVYSRSDELTNVAAVEELIKGLKVPVYRSVFLNQDINHLGLLLSKDAPWQVNLPILEVFESFSYESGDCRPLNL